MLRSYRTRVVSTLVLCAAVGVWVLCETGVGGGAGKNAKPRVGDALGTAAGRPAGRGGGSRTSYKSPTGVAFSVDGGRVYVTNRTANTLSVIDAGAGKVVAEIRVGRGPTGVAASPGGRWVYAACTWDHSVCVVDVEARKPKIVATIKVGFEPIGLVISLDGKRVYTANYISNDVSVIDTATRKQIARIPVGRAPTYMALTPDGRKLIVNNSLSHQAATEAKLSAHVSIIDTVAGKVVAKKRSPGTMLLGMGVAVSVDGKTAYAVHSRPNFNITPSQLSQGWVHTNALSIIPLEGDRPVITVLLDNVSGGMANPQGVAISGDGRRLYVGHRGVHMLSVVDLPKLTALIKRTAPEALARTQVNLGYLWQRGDIVTRVPAGGLCPNDVAVSPKDGSVWVANYFSDSVAVLDGATAKVTRTVALAPPRKMTPVRRGEFLFNDGKHCFQQWLSCTSCHPYTRADGVNWDLLNDGRANPKNAKSLVGSWATPPAMITGVRPSMEVAVEKGFLFIQFVKADKSELDAVRAYLRAEKFITSPFGRKSDGTLTEAARRGQKIFSKANCDMCHPAPLYTDMEKYNVGTLTERNLPTTKEFDTPGLIELYRTGPYLHDGRAVTIEEVITKYNPNDQHGETRGLSKQELADLVAFLKSL